jgi:hypothetical protein
LLDLLQMSGHQFHRRDAPGSHHFGHF